MKRDIIKKCTVAFLVSFLLCFMLLIFGPSEIFFANVTEFDFVYGEFAGNMALFALAGAVIFTLLFSFLPDGLYRTAVSLVFAVAVGGYMQVMFLNKNLDLLGVNPDGYKAGTGRCAVNLIIWIAVIAFVLALAFWKKDIWKKLIVYLSAFLLCIQAVALISLTVTAEKEAYSYPGPTYHLSGEKQYVVSADKNIIVLILDGFSNQYIDPLLTAYPGATDFLHDFTYYSNADCTYWGTFPSLPHMMTGKEYDMSKKVNDWLWDIWKDKNTKAFYDGLSDLNYVTNLYTPNNNILCGQSSVDLMGNSGISNVEKTSQSVDVSYGLLYKTLTKMSCYRMFPEILKNYFYTNHGEYTKIVEVRENKINHQNYDFYQDLLDKGLTADESHNYYIVQHLTGTHDRTTDAMGNHKEDASIEETAKGCMVVVEKYLECLKELGVYDDAVIIITADHGNFDDSQVIFYMKEAGEKHDKSPVNAAPISHNEFLPTIAEAAGMDYTAYGQSIHDFKDGEERARTLWRREQDKNYPKVLYYTGDSESAFNVYDGYTYTGGIDELLEQIEAGPSQVVQVADSMY